MVQCGGNDAETRPPHLVVREYDELVRVKTIVHPLKYHFKPNTCERIRPENIRAYSKNQYIPE